MSDVTDIERFLATEGYDGREPAARARAVLEAAGLTRPGKKGIAAEKLPRARAALEARLVRVCGNIACGRIARARLGDGREAVTVAQSACEICGGSNNRRAAEALARRLKHEGIERILIVGGTPTLHAELDALLASHGLKLRFVDGAVGSHSLKDAMPNLLWSQVAVIWGASPLPHKVSRLYTDTPPPHVRVVKFARRGIEALCTEVLHSFEAGEPTDTPRAPTA